MLCTRMTTQHYTRDQSEGDKLRGTLISTHTKRGTEVFTYDLASEAERPQRSDSHPDRTMRRRSGESVCGIRVWNPREITAQ